MAQKIKQYTIGKGRPLICVSIVEIEKDQICQVAVQAVKQGAEVLEWRMDWFAQIEQWGKTEQILSELAKICQETVLLCTFRSKSQGGEQQLSQAEYIQLMQNVAKSGYVDLLDLEVMECANASAVIEKLHQAGQKIIGSQHYFSHTPETVQMRQELLQIQEAGADIGKLAVMPQNAMDVLRLLEATVQTKEDYPDYPLVTMAMGGLGTVSRISGQIFGSCMTFASLGKISAPGQLPLQNMTEILEKISESIQR